MKDNIFLTGFSGTGKTTSGHILAELLGYEFVDTDQVIEHKTGRSIPEIFEQEGEEVFRQLETTALEEIAKRDLQVVSTGGGIVISKANRTEMTANGYIVCLEGRAETIYVRLLLGTPELDRPLLQSEDPFERIQNLKSSRASFYTEADWTIHTDFLTPEETARQIVAALPVIRRRSIGKRGRSDSTMPVRGGARETPSINPLIVKTSGGIYPLLFGDGLLDQLGTILNQNLPESKDRRVFVITDSHLFDIYSAKVLAALGKAGYRGAVKAVLAGEESKSLKQAEQLYDWLRSERAERQDLILALGGGVVGDLAGFVAATWLRGLPFVQIPTTLLAMVDSSVGGKTGVNLAQGKNLVGAFYQPRLVVADVSTLRTLPERAHRSGWAEVIKHAVIPGADKDEKGAVERFQELEEYFEPLMNLEPEITAGILQRSVAVKAGVVAVDERETGLRITLNYGHTFAHALEAAGEYNTLLHGEAVAIGMHGVALLSERMGLCTQAFVERQQRLIEKFGLPLHAPPGTDKQKVIESLRLDKKSEAGAVRWILPVSLGKLEIRRDVPPQFVEEVLNLLLN